MLLEPLRDRFKAAFRPCFLCLKAANLLSRRLRVREGFLGRQQLRGRLLGGCGIGQVTVATAKLTKFVKLSFEGGELAVIFRFNRAPMLSIGKRPMQGSVCTWALLGIREVAPDLIVDGV